MSVRLTLRSRESLDWLYASITKTLGNQRSKDGPVNADLLELLEGLVDDLHAAVQPVEAQPVKRVKPKQALKGDKPFEPKLCPEHPKYGAIRCPRADCATCWEAYTQLNPLTAKAARAKFERKQRSG